MTVIIAVVIAVTASIAAVGAGAVAQVTATRARAQVAADAAALAAVATSVPGRWSDPRAAADRYAGLNGGHLEECWCVAGDTAMQVRVRIGELSAVARAVFDPDLLRPLSI